MKFNKLFENLMQESTISVGMFAGSFTPPHRGHFEAALQMVNDKNDYSILLASAKDRQGSGGAVSELIWRDVYIPLLNGNVILQYSPISPVKDMADLVILTKDQPVNNPSSTIEKLSTKLIGNKVVFNIYGGEDRIESYEKSFKKYEDENISINTITTDRPIVNLGTRTFDITDKKGNTTQITGTTDMSGTLIRNLIKQIKYEDPLMTELFPPQALSNPHLKDLLSQL